MAFNAQPGEQYTIRRKVLKIFGASFHVYAPDGRVVAFCKQKAFKLREDIRLYTDDSCTTELLLIKARQVIDFSATYDVTLPTGQVLASLRRKGLASTFLKDSWIVFDAAGRELATLTERGGFLAFLRHWVEIIAALSPQTFTLERPGKPPIAQYRTHFNLFVYRLGVSILADDPEIDDLVILACGCLIAAIEGRQQT